MNQNLVGRILGRSSIKLLIYFRSVTASNKVYQLLARGRWFSPAFFTTKTGRHDIADILLKVVLKHQQSNQIWTRKITEGHKQKHCRFYREKQ
jgi:hypothetical protein